MSQEEPPGGERTEPATEERMRKVRQKGELSRSQEITGWVAVGAGAAMTPMTLGRGEQMVTNYMLSATTVAQHPEEARATELLASAPMAAIDVLWPMLAVVSVAVLAASAAQGGIHFRQFRIHHQQFNPVNAAKKVLGPQAWWNGAKTALKALAVGSVLASVIVSMHPLLTQAGGMSAMAILQATGRSAAVLLIGAVGAALAIAALDLLVVMRRNRKKTRMTVQEVKDELKNTEGDPLIRAQRRSRHLSASRNAMIAATADADAVVVNPTHVAVALSYQAGVTPAPKVVARGAGHLARRIREVAQANQVPIVRNITLARGIYGTCQAGSYVPVGLYGPVAVVLRFAMNLKAYGTSTTSKVHHMSDADLNPTSRRTI